MPKSSWLSLTIGTKSLADVHLVFVGIGLTPRQRFNLLATELRWVRHHRKDGVDGIGGRSASSARSPLVVAPPNATRSRDRHCARKQPSMATGSRELNDNSRHPYLILNRVRRREASFPRCDTGAEVNASA
jgi:hypothetical protein